MKKDLNQTIESRLPAYLTEQFNGALKQYAAHYQRALRTMVARKNRGESINKSLFMTEFQLTGRQFNAIKSEVDGLFQSQLANYQRYIVEAQHKNANRSARIAELEQAISDAHLIDDTSKKHPVLFKLHQELRGCHNRAVKAEHKINRWQQLIDNKQISVCFGSREQFKKQYWLDDNSYSDHQQWRQDFTSRREDEIFTLGSKDERCGNQSCTVVQNEQGLFDLRLRLPSGMNDEYGSHLTLNNIPFNYRTEKLVNALTSNQLRTQMQTGWAKNDSLKQRYQHNLNALTEHQDNVLDNMTERGDSAGVINQARENYLKTRTRFANYTKSNALTDFGQAISYRFKRDHKGWRIIVSLSCQVEDVFLTDKRLGAIGIDLNEHHLAVTETDSRGNKVQSFDITFRDKNYDDTSEQTKSGLGLAIKQVMTLATKTGKPVVIENLDFKAKKAKLKSGKQAQYNKMVSSLVTAKFLSMIKLRCAEQSVELIQVNAAYTSMIGRLKYGNISGYNVHQAAALVIARRGMGLSDRHLPKTTKFLYRCKQMIFSVPEDTGSCDTFVYYRQVQRQLQKWFEHIKAMSAPPKLVLPQTAFCQDIPQ